MAVESPPDLPWKDLDLNDDSVEVVLDLAYRQLDRQSQQTDRLNSKASWFLGLAGTSLALSLNLFSSLFRDPPLAAVGGLTLGIGALAVALILSLRALGIRSTGVSPFFWNVLHEDGHRERLAVQYRILNGLADDYLTTEKINADRTRGLTRAGGYLVAGIALVAATTVVFLAIRPLIV